MRPGEIADEEFMKNYNQLVEYPLPNVHYHFGDATDPSIAREIHEINPRRNIKMAVVATMLNQAGQEKVPRGIDTALRIVRKGGVALFLEFARCQPDEPSQLLLEHEWSNWTYGLFAVHEHDRSRTVHHLMSFKDSRMTSARVEGGLLDAGSGYLPMREHLERAA
jgi:hypothetical protein